MADLSSASSQTLRRSERRGKYHFDVASMFGNKAAHCDEVSDQSLHPKKKSKKPANSAIQKFSTTEAGESHNVRIQTIYQNHTNYVKIYRVIFRQITHVVQITRQPMVGLNFNLF
jgi:hypothetical protein